MLGRAEAARDAVAVKDLAIRRAGRGAPRPARRLAARRGLEEPAGPPVMRTHRAGDLRPDARRRARSRSAAGSRSRRDHGGVVFLDLRDAAGARAGRRRPAVDAAASTRTPSAAEYVLRVEGEVRARPEGTVNAELPTGAGRGGAADGRGAQRGRPAPDPASTSASRPTRSCGCATATSTCAARALQRNLRLRAAVNRGAARRARRRGLRRGRDADADRVDTRRCARLRRAVAAVSPARSTRCRRARSCSSSC